MNFTSRCTTGDLPASFGMTGPAVIGPAATILNAAPLREKTSAGRPTVIARRATVEVETLNVTDLPSARARVSDVDELAVTLPRSTTNASVEPSARIRLTSAWTPLRTTRLATCAFFALPFPPCAACATATAPPATSSATAEIATTR